ncbi:hypothetical protein [Persephonella sp.]
MKFTVSTYSGLIQTDSFKSACRIMRMEFERKKRQMEAEKKELEQMKKEMLEWIDKTFVMED